MAALRTSLVLVVFVWVLASSGVLAGNRAWESRINRDYGNNGGVFAGPLNHSFSKRWYINIDERFYEPWSNGNIKACFQNKKHTHEGVTKTTEQILRGHLQGARERWRTAGLDDNDGWFKFELLDTDDALCQNPDERTNFLLAIYAGEGVEEMATSLGRQKAALRDASFEDKGSKMLLSDSVNMGMGNIVANFAHEMGHAWGMHHEHQNPRWWSGDDSLSTNWYCNQLSDYQDAVRRVNNDPKIIDKANVIEKMCKDQGTATLVKFTGAMNWLPIELGKDPVERKVPDWKSIMIYPSNCGGVSTGSGKATVMLKPGKSHIKPAYKPSSLDVDGLYTMYGRDRPKPPSLLQKMNGKFKSVFKLNNGGCSR